MGDLSAHFSRSEFECGCGCGFDNIDPRLVAVLQRLREFFGKPVTVTSACRCVSHNAAVGGSERSQHLHGIASDVQVQGIAPDLVADVVEELFENRPRGGGVGRYETFTHIDIRRTKARWDET